MTDWTIQECVNCPGCNEDTNALLDDGDGPGLVGGWAEGWAYLGGNIESGDTVTVLHPDLRSAEELGYTPAPLGWSPFWDPDKHGPLGIGAPPPGWTFNQQTRRWDPPV